ncbi:MAG TPA: hypothetical protein VK762_16980 [Polyangiaceae bacterium]|nr:hypothetical protein [Polyangiaceae bacterium]
MVFVMEEMGAGECVRIMVGGARALPDRLEAAAPPMPQAYPSRMSGAASNANWIPLDSVRRTGQWAAALATAARSSSDSSPKMDSEHLNVTGPSP